jgi:hypothetical protein
MLAPGCSSLLHLSRCTQPIWTDQYENSNGFLIHVKVRTDNETTLAEHCCGFYLISLEKVDSQLGAEHTRGSLTRLIDTKARKMALRYHFKQSHAAFSKQMRYAIRNCKSIEYQVLDSNYQSRR